jgi:hypothetical protein
MNQQVRRAGREAAAWVEGLARLGYVSKGAVYLILGLLAAEAGMGKGGATADRRDTIGVILHMPFGRALLLVMAAGLLGYALWRVSSGLFDSERRGHDAKGSIIRIGSMMRGLFYGAFAFEVLRVVLHRGNGGSGSDAAARHWTQRLMDKPTGRWGVAIAGLTIIGYGLYQLGRAWSGKLGKQLDLRRAGASARRWMSGISRFGMAARGIVFGVIGVSLIRAALRHNPAAARGTSGALRQIASQPFGGWLLAITGLGLAAYGIYGFINARYRRIDAA